jgi:hypothetical protein
MSKPVKNGPHFVRVVSSVAANTFTVFENVFINPTESSTVNLYAASNVADTPAAPPTTPVRLTPFYKWLTAGIFLVAVVCLLLEFATGFAWPEPTAAQANIIGAVDYGWKMGFGVVVGLLTGKGIQ